MLDVLFGGLCEDEYPVICARIISVVVEEIWVYRNDTAIGGVRRTASSVGDSVFAGQRVGIPPTQFRSGSTILFRLDCQLEIFARRNFLEPMVGFVVTRLNCLHLPLLRVLQMDG